MRNICVNIALFLFAILCVDLALSQQVRCDEDYESQLRSIDGERLLPDVPIPWQESEIVMLDDAIIDLSHSNAIWDYLESTHEYNEEHWDNVGTQEQRVAICNAMNLIFGSSKSDGLDRASAVCRVIFSEFSGHDHYKYPDEFKTSKGADQEWLDEKFHRLPDAVVDEFYDEVVPYLEIAVKQKRMQGWVYGNKYYVFTGGSNEQYKQDSIMGHCINWSLAVCGALPGCTDKEGRVLGKGSFAHWRAKIVERLNKPAHHAVMVWPKPITADPEDKDTWNDRTIIDGRIKTIWEDGVVFDGFFNGKPEIYESIEWNKGAGLFGDLWDTYLTTDPLEFYAEYLRSLGDDE
ncbi:hypothetical protein ACFL6Y_05195 [Elusimicrobiota bacterium]